jgi:FkbM family methyltransferase
MVGNGLIALSIPQSRTPLLVRGNTSDVQTFEQIFIDNEYDAPLDISPKTIVDGGANVGYASVYFANRFPDARIIAVEPHSANAEMLAKNTAAYPNLVIIRAGIWHKKTLLKIENPEAEEWAFRVTEATPDTLEFEAITITDIMGSANVDHIDILKLDIEGAEKEVLSHSREWIDKISVLIIELHDRFKPGCSEALYAAISGRHFLESRKGENIFLQRVAG